MSAAEEWLIARHAPKSAPRRRLRAFAAELGRTVAGGGRFLCLLTNDHELRRLNREFRGKDEPADVLSFPEPAGDSLGEIAISARRAAEQARERGHAVEEEIGILMLHGVLHLMGMDHERDRGRMARAETRWRKALGLPRGLIERVRR
jgi:probable rRNA maturation factor